MKPFAAFAAIVVLASCATSPEFPVPNDLWETFTGQLHYITPERSVVGEFTAARHAEDFRLDFSKGDAFPLLKLSQHGELLRAEGPLARGRWHGRVESAPPHLRGWARVPAGFATLEKNVRFPRTGVRPEVVVDRGRPKVLTVPGGQAGERFIFRFNH
jgi:hypothetical protein